ncbi:uncharacterized protein UV8b_04157 [Ustilaginoidea virens]|uniref:Uncharacterized protein n=1 Tax=Ustilaginoidea virens TaxID=1159556 RepID=A0A8E5HQW4_USTVR|nr:uncharacterized protein UV8b_04157 [Ustilaginoidea virens]QUC19916.1 hypothetical protein UV8b_04157 [Ustilaginoidea virens]
MGGCETKTPKTRAHGGRGVHSSEEKSAGAAPARMPVGDQTTCLVDGGSKQAERGQALGSTAGPTDQTIQRQEPTLDYSVHMRFISKSAAVPTLVGTGTTRQRPGHSHRAPRGSQVEAP